MPNDEIDAIKQVNDALNDLDEEARTRVLNWALNKFSTNVQPPNPPGHNPPDGNSINKKDGEIAGVARLDSEGKFYITIRDVKAKNTNDAAIRLTHIIIWAYKQLTGEGSVSSKNIVTPILKEWRAYTGNTRNALSKHKGLLRNGDALSLDAHSQRDAEKFVKDALDEEVEGKWKP